MIETGHYYTPQGEPMHWVPKKDGSGNRPTTIADCRKLGLLPSVTQVLRILDKPALVNWKIHQAVLAISTAPIIEGEGLDARIDRILNQSREQDEESEIAKDRGSAIHGALEAYFNGITHAVLSDIAPWIMPAAQAISAYGKVHACEKILVGEGYAGKTDLILESPDCWWLIDWKTTRKLPDKGAWFEHRCQNSAYCKAFVAQPAYTSSIKGLVRTGNVYISTVDCGKFVIHEHQGDWRNTFDNAFLPLLTVWRFLNNM